MITDGPVADLDVSRRPASTRAFALLAVLAGMIGAALIPGSRAGIGQVATGAAIAVAVFTAIRPVPRASLLHLVGALALLSMAAIRDAGWVVALDVIGAVILATLGACAAADWRWIGRSPFHLGMRLIRAPGFVLRGIFPGPRTANLWPGAARTAAIVATLLVVFGALFAAADPAFAHLLGRYLLPEIDLALLPGRTTIFALVVLYAGAAVLASPGYASVEPTWPGIRVALGLEETGPWRLRSWEWLISLGLLDLLFLTFVGVQITVLFGGHEHVLTTAGLTYAEYAREGFFQLIAAALLTVGVVAGAARWAVRDRPSASEAFHALLGLLCVLTLVILASALKRLDLYVDAFGLTRARVAAQGVALWTGGLFILILLAGATRRSAWLAPGVVALSAVALLVFSLANPEGRIAGRNVERFTTSGRIDAAYLSTLSADAVPTLVRLPADLRACVLAPIAHDLRTPDGAGGWNRSRARARELLREHPTTGLACAKPAAA